MDINNPQIFDHLVASSGEILRIKLMDIGDWDMNTSGDKTVAHGLNWEKIVAVCAIIANDYGSDRRNLEGMVGDPYDGYQGVVTWSNTHIWLRRNNRGAFDNAGYSTIPFNRGVITILYTD